MENKRPLDLFRTSGVGVAACEGTKGPLGKYAVVSGTPTSTRIPPAGY